VLTGGQAEGFGAHVHSSTRNCSAGICIHYRDHFITFRT